MTQIKHGAYTRNQNTSSTGGDRAKYIDSALCVDDLGPLPKAMLGPDYMKPAPTAAFPGSDARTGINNAPGFNGFSSDGEPGLLGTTDAPAAHDDNYPSLPGPEFPGEAGTTNMGDQGQPLDWKSVGPYMYPEYPMSQPKQDKSGGITDTVPLT